MASYDQDVARNNKTPNYQLLKNTAVKLHIDQMMRNQNFRIRNDGEERGSVTKSRKGHKACVERKVGACFLWKAQERCSKRDSCSFSHDPLLANGNKVVVREKKDDRLLPHPMQKQEINRKFLQIRLKFHANSNSVKIRHVDSGILLCV